MNKVAPKPNEFELSLFGPGTGECIVIHYGDNNWFVIDSFREKENDIPIAQAYLESIGVNVHQNVKHILATHFDDDHCDGLTELLANCDDAKFHCSTALLVNEFFACVKKNGNLKLVQAKPGLSEFADILEFLEKSSQIPDRCRSTYGPNWVHAGSQISLSNKVTFSILSPSSIAVGDSAREFKDAYLDTTGPVKKLPQNRFNMISVAGAIETSNLSLLLGADLERGGNDHVGWRGVLNDSNLRKPLSSIFKIPHHGSEGADVEGVWTQLVGNEPTLLLTSMASSGIPRESDVVRLKSKTNNEVVLTNPKYITRPKKHGAANRRMNLITRSRKIIRRQLGQVCIRFELGTDAISIEKFGAARALNRRQ